MSTRGLGLDLIGGHGSLRGVSHPSQNYRETVKAKITLIFVFS